MALKANMRTYYWWCHSIPASCLTTSDQRKHKRTEFVRTAPSRKQSICSGRVVLACLWYSRGSWMGAESYRIVLSTGKVWMPRCLEWMTCPCHRPLPLAYVWNWDLRFHLDLFRLSCLDRLPYICRFAWIWVLPPGPIWLLNPMAYGLFPRVPTCSVWIPLKVDLSLQDIFHLHPPLLVIYG